jgi:excisionase family DNA binding protein
MAIEASKVYQLSQLAQELGVHVETVRQWVRSGKLTASRIGRKYFVSGSDVLQHQAKPDFGNPPEIQAHYRARLKSMRDDAIGTALALLQKDIRDPVLTGKEAIPDAFMLRANSIGLALFQNHCFALAEQLYRRLTDETLRYRQVTGNWRHAGALYANWAVACVAVRDFDGAIIHFLQAAAEDLRTYGQAQHESFAIKGLLENDLRRPVRAFALKVARRVDSSLGPEDIQALCGRLGSDLEYALLVYLNIAWTHESANQQFPNVFSSLQLLSAMRNLTCLLEVELKTMLGDMEKELFDTITQLYKNKSWWKAFHQKAKGIGVLENTGQSVDDQLAAAIQMCPTDGLSRFQQSLLVVCIVRNYAAHQLETQCTLVKKYSAEALGHIVHAMIVAPRHV